MTGLDLNYLSDGQPVTPYASSGSSVDSILLGEWRYTGNMLEEQMELIEKYQYPDSYTEYGSTQVGMVTKAEKPNKKVTIQTNQYIHYVTGTKNIFYVTFRFGGKQEHLFQRAGVFDDDNGIFLEQPEEDELQIVVRGGTTVGTILRSQWNINKLDGTEELEFEDDSSVVLDMSKTQTLVISYDWGYNFFSVGFVVGAEVVLVHQQSFNNIEADLFMGKPNLPVRWQIENDSIGPKDNGKMYAISCAAFRDGSPNSEGSTQKSVIGIASLTGLQTNKAALAIKLSGTNKVGIRLKEYHVSASGNASFFIASFQNTWYTGGVWTGVAGMSKCEKSIDFNPDINWNSDGRYRLGVNGYLESKIPVSGKIENNKAMIIGQNPDLTEAQVLLVMCSNLDTSPTDVKVSLVWDELR